MRIALWLCCLLFLSQKETAQAQVNCYPERLCQGTRTVASTIRECCLTRDGVTLAGGMSFDTAGEACQTCVVFGWRAGFSFVASERGEAYSLSVGYLKGADSAPGNGRLRFNVEDTEGTAVEGVNNDYRVSNTQNLDVRLTTDREVQVTFRVDRVALEPDETLTLTLDPQNNLAMALDSNVFLLQTIQLTIQDSDVVGFQFTVPLYRVREESQSVPVVVERNLRIATDVTLRITPVNFTQVNVTGFLFPEDFPDVPEFDPIRPIIAKSYPEERRDFNIAPVEITFPHDEVIFSADVDASIQIFDDVINEADEVFVILLEVVSDVLLARMTLQTRGASLCRIVDNDPISIGFELPRYDFVEQFRSFSSDSPVFLIKEDNRESEQTFEVVVTAGPAQDPSVDDATPLEAATEENPPDYRVISPQTYIFRPDEDRIPVPFQLFDDPNPELTEGFLQSSSPSEDSPPFQSGVNPSTTIAIIDHDRLRIGFTRTFTSVRENVGFVELCLTIFNVPPEVELAANLLLFIELETEDGTAVEMEDYARIDFDNNPLNDFFGGVRMQCFDVTIQDDSQFELTERFSIAAFTFDFDASIVEVNPNVSVVQILDNDDPTLGVLIGILEDHITAREDAGSVTVRVMKVGSLSPQQPVRVMFTTVDSTARAGQDYRATSTVITFGPEDTETTVTIPLINDEVVEGQESFTAVLSLVSPPPNVELAQSEVQLIITDDDANTVQFSQSSYTVGEDEGTAVLMVQKVGSNAIPLEVSLTMISGSARRGIDFQIAETLVVPSGGTQQLTVPVLITDDGVPENTEFFEVTIGSSDQVNVGTSQRARVEITDNDVAELGFTQGSLRVLESDGSASVTVQLQTEVERTITVRLFTQNDQATAPSDYTAVQRVLTFDSSTTSATIPIRIVNDDFIEADERFFVRLELVPGQSGVVISRRRTRIIIETDDECPELGATVSEKPLVTTDPQAIQCVNVCFPRLSRMKICPNRVGTGV